MKKDHTILIDKEKCIGCGLCVGDCPASNIQLISKKASNEKQASNEKKTTNEKKASIIEQNCIMCGHCVAICPKGAVSMTGFDEPPVEIQAPTRLDPDTLLAAIRTRRSIRKFTGRQVEPESIKKIIEAGRLTPTGGNAQDVSFVVLKNRIDLFEQAAVSLFRRLLPMMKLVNPIARRTVIDDHFFFKKAPVAVVIIARDEIDGALAASNMALMAEACGLGVLYSGFFALAANHSRALKRMLKLKRDEKVVTTLVLGYSAVTYRRTAQKEAAKVRYQ